MSNLGPSRVNLHARETHCGCVVCSALSSTRRLFMKPGAMPLVSMQSIGVDGPVGLPHKARSTALYVECAFSTFHTGGRCGSVDCSRRIALKI